MSDRSRMSYLLLGCSPRSISNLIIMPATPFVARQIEKRFDEDPKKHGDVLNGTMDGLPVSIIQSGIGAPSTACKMEGIRHAKDAVTLIRVDYCGALLPEIRIGDIIIPTAALRGDGTTPHYVRSGNLPISAHPELLSALMAEADKKDIKYHAGPVWTHDALLKEPPELIEKARSHGAIGIDMETSAVFTIGEIYNLKTASILVVTDNPSKNQTILTMTSFPPRILNNLQKSIDIMLAVFKEENKNGTI